MELRLGVRILTLGQPRVMGILNFTPDSFSDGGRFLSPDDALEHAASMAEQGADIIDVGGESTRPGAAELPLQQDLVTASVLGLPHVGSPLEQRRR